MAKVSSAAPKLQAAHPPVVEPPKQLFEFASDTWKNNEAQIFAARAADGWELVSVTESPNFERRYYFKRQI